MGLHRKYDDSVKLYETALGNIQKQLGSQHPKTKATNAAYIRVLCEDLKIKKALRAWLQQVQVDGVMNQLPLLLMIFYHFSKAFGAFDTFSAMLKARLCICISLAAKQ